MLGLIVLARDRGDLHPQRSRACASRSIEESPKHITVELQNAQAVEPGQGQTVRVAGVEVGRISGVEVVRTASPPSTSSSSPSTRT